MVQAKGNEFEPQDGFRDERGETLARIDSREAGRAGLEGWGLSGGGGKSLNVAGEKSPENRNPDSFPPACCTELECSFGQIQNQNWVRYQKYLALTLLDATHSKDGDKLD